MKVKPTPKPGRVMMEVDDRDGERTLRDRWRFGRRRRTTGEQEQQGNAGRSSHVSNGTTAAASGSRRGWLS